MPPAVLAQEWTTENYALFMAMFEVVRLMFVFAFGACVGSLVNVLVYRLPLGLDVVTPTSRCPSCETYLTWRENVPVFGWLMLRGKCRFCRSPISAEYPIVEAFVGLMFVVTYLVLYAEGGSFLGIPFGAIRPEWAESGFAQTWPSFIIVLILFSCLTAMTIVDARTFTIPLELMWPPVVVALVGHVGHAIWIEATRPTGVDAFGLVRTAGGWDWSIATPGQEGWWWIGAALGGTVGVILSNVFLQTGLFTRSFADYPEWEAKVLKEADEKAKAEGVVDGRSQQDLWIQYPHARREMLRELIFVAPILGLAMIGGWAAHRYGGPWQFDVAAMRMSPFETAPLWLVVLAGVLMGYLIGGAVVWGVRILGSLAFGKEAMGLGDVHLLAAVGACLGWVDAVAAFFIGTFLGAIWGVAGRLLAGRVSEGDGRLKRVLTAPLPFGPHLAIATLLVWFGKPALEWGLSRIMRGEFPIDLP